MAYLQLLSYIAPEIYRPAAQLVISQGPTMWWSKLFALAPAAVLSFAAPSGFPASGNGLWYNTPGNLWSKTYLPVGNGFLGAMTPGGASVEITQLNIESLWSGGPFQDPAYNGGNKRPSEAPAAHKAMESIHASIFASSTGQIDNIEALTTDPGAYGSYASAGYLISTMNISGPVTGFARWLDMDEGVARVTWSQSSNYFTRETFCSHPSQACYHRIASSNATLPSTTFAFATLGSLLPTPKITCLDSRTLQVRGFASEPGMLYEILGKVQSTYGRVACTALSANNATISVTGATEAWIAWVGGTEYSMDAGNAKSNFSFRGADPHASLTSLLSPASSSYQDALVQHIADIKATLYSRFSLSLGQKPQLNIPTDQIRAAYQVDKGNPYLEWLTFNLGRYMLASSARGTLPANLQGKWAKDPAPWGADANINIQMNYWSAEMSNLDVTRPLFDYFEKTWAPRGAMTAQTLYNISRGWVAHNEVRIFGHTGMKGGTGAGNTALWANYPESAVWMMIHVWDHFDHTNDVAWWKAQGWPLLKGVASFQLDKLIPDLYFNDSTLVVAPCNSPEQSYITFGCAHAQQMIWQMFNAVEKGFKASGDTDIAFLNEVRSKRARMDKGLRIGRWGQLQEWKVDLDSPTDTHRHLSHLIGLYPGYAISSYDLGLQGGLIANRTNTTYTKSQVMDAAMVSLAHRGNGTGPDADAGWEKVWRAAAWAQFGNAPKFYHELTYTIYETFGPNLFSLYNPFDPDPLFQIDANLGFPAAVLNALLQAQDVPSFDIPLVITLLPALPAAWPSGQLKGARTRGGITVDLQWSNGKPTTVALAVDSNPISASRSVRVVFAGKIVGSFTTKPNFRTTIQRF
ncbi:glycoside hydrolase family 95 protein [Botryobasidium botryosum FD-172 SS1]|uniref:Glycoside hydrolase family 95 protein n=1 Tax=Botryobasidium botryosum (strain FD-172 SS1) TaxID=930990 RepID=A0A067M4V6_BOTB1|nr:glycoside hydrolase family 95 protein [Botryobasidium botryosum FD-172 SS1]